jgi:hypothetical protein
VVERLDGMVRQLRARHITGLSEADRKIIIGQLMGLEGAALAGELFLGERTVKEHWRGIRARVGAALDLQPSGVVVGGWGVFHTDCCLRLPPENGE